MNNSKTPKIVVGIGLAAVYATALATFMPRGAHDNVVARNASAAPPTQVAPEPAPPPAIVPAIADTSTSVTQQAAVMTAAAVPVASITTKTTAKTVEAPLARKESEAKSQSQEQPVASVATASLTKESEVDAPTPASEGNSATHDNLNTAEVKSQLAAVAPDSAVDVTTNGGAVELTESVSSEE